MISSRLFSTNILKRILILFPIQFIPFLLMAQAGTYVFIVHTEDCLNDSLPFVRVWLDQIPTPKTSSNPRDNSLYHYYAVSDSNGIATFDSVNGALYKLRAYRVGYDSLIVNSILIDHDDSITINLLPRVSPPREFFVDSMTSVATWEKPRKNIIPYESFEGDVFPPEGWQVMNAPYAGTCGWYRYAYLGNDYGFPVNPGDDYYAMAGSYNCGSGPYCDSYLVTPMINLRDYDTAILNYDSYYLGEDTLLVPISIEYSVDSGNTWTVYDNPPRLFHQWVHESIDLTSMGSPSDTAIWIAFHGKDNHYFSDVWIIDHVSIDEGPADVLGYYIFLDDNLIDFLPPDTLSYYYENLAYGQTYKGSIKAVYQCRTSEEKNYIWTSSFLYPPLNFNVSYVPTTDEAGLYWTPPEIVEYDTGAANLIGYNLYVDDSVEMQIPYQGETINYQYLAIIDSLNAGHRIFRVAAQYDLTDYGFPGQTAESFTEPYTEFVNYGYLLPFYEPWDVADFNYHQWTLSGNHGSWEMTSFTGNPPASAAAHADTVNTYFETGLTSYLFDASELTQGRIMVDFSLMADLKKHIEYPNYLLFRINLISEEQNGSFFVRYFHDPMGFTDFTEPLPTYAMGQVFQLKFMVYGENDTLGNTIYLDNIKVYWKSPAPKNLTGDYFWQTDSAGNDNFGALIKWNPPEDITLSNREFSLLHFNVYRKTESEDDFSLYAQVNYTPDADTFSFYDEYPDVTVGELYLYKVTAWWDSDYSGSNESLPANNYQIPGLDYVYVFITSTKENGENGEMVIYPNPAYNKLNVKSLSPVKEIRVFSIAGKIMLTKKVLEKHDIQLDISSLPSGIYLIAVNTENGIKTAKIVKR